jgi:hypothetical protein
MAQKAGIVTRFQYIMLAHRVHPAKFLHVL